MSLDPNIDQAMNENLPMDHKYMAIGNPTQKIPKPVYKANTMGSIDTLDRRVSFIGIQVLPNIKDAPTTETHPMASARAVSVAMVPRTDATYAIEPITRIKDTLVTFIFTPSFSPLIVLSTVSKVQSR